ncbi:MAG: SDR family oxidoreductase [Betaproteobacteria bacterium]|nr:SDR family oxidoreductase [Betaproteobacteria bacterium]
MILLTGASGFVGQGVLASLIRTQPVRVALRHPDAAFLTEGVDVVRACLSQDQDWLKALSGVSSVIHCAARVHVMNEEAADPLAEFRRINVDGTLNLARQAAVAGVRRFVFVSSVKVNGEYSEPGHPFLADQRPAPGDSYGVSKCEAEAGLRALSQEAGMEVVIIRPPLVYGPGVKANFLAMMRWLQRGVPLPLGAVTDNRRSLVFLENLVDLIVTCIDHPAAANQTFLVSDDEDLSTEALLRRTAAALGRPARLIPVPAGLLTVGAGLIGRSAVAERLCGSLQVDIGKTKTLLNWRPPVSLDEGLLRTAAHWLGTEWSGNVNTEFDGK